MKITRHFTKPEADVFSTVAYETRQSVAPTGTVTVEVPKTWSQTASDILAQKYLRRREVPKRDAKGKAILDAEGRPEMGGEESVKEVIDRLVGCWKHWGEKLHYFDTPKDAQAFYDELVHMLLNQMAAPNSPQWFNTGLHHKYAVTGPAQGHYYVDEADDQVKPSVDAYSRPQPHACFIQSVDDNLLGDSGIYSLLEREGRVFKYGSGSGTNFSSIRAAGESLGGGGASSGLMSFLKVFDRAAAAIKSGGTTRRAAKMVCLDLDHPEIEAFIGWKRREEFKVAALAAGSAMQAEILQGILDLGDSRKHGEGERTRLLDLLARGLQLHLPEGVLLKAVTLAEQGVKNFPLEEMGAYFEGEAYETVSGQNGNNTVRIPNAFMRALREDDDWHLLARGDGSIRKTVKARKLWEDIGTAAWDCADPGLQFSDTINEWHTCPADGPIRASNPCSEYLFLDDTACNLASLNLVRFQNQDGSLEVDAFGHAVRLWTLVLDISVSMAQFPSPLMARKSADFRTLGLGYSNLGAFLMRAGIPYDSEKAEAWTSAISALLGGAAYTASAELAHALYPFPRFEANRESMLKVIRNHRRAAWNAAPETYEGLSVLPAGLDGTLCPPEMVDAAREIWNEAVSLGEAHGYRNAQVSALAPTGTIGLLMDCDTTGIEPDFALVKHKKLSGGGWLKIVNRSVPFALRNLGYTPVQIRDIENYCLGSGTLEAEPKLNPETLRRAGFTYEDIIAVEKRLASVLSLEQAFSPSLLEASTLENLGFTPGDNTTGMDVLLSLAMSPKQINLAELRVCGAQSVEGAPHLLLEHYPIFDCATACGRGIRSIAPKGHLRIMAAAQPFISGGISKTVNLPWESGIDEVKEVFAAAWGRMVKAITVYRDGSKLSQPLGSLPKAAQWMEDARAHALREAPIPKEKNEITEPVRAHRRRLPARRGGFVQEVSISGHKLFLRTGEYPDGSLGEIFIDMYKEGAAYRSLLNCFAVLASKALQYGMPLEKMVETFTFTRFEPAGPVSGHENVKQCTSILDLIFRVIGLQYLGRTDFVHVKPKAMEDDLKRNNPNEPELVYSSVKVTTLTTDSEGSRFSQVQAVKAGYTGESCGSCGSVRVRRNGTCTVCEDCGGTSGCS